MRSLATSLGVSVVLLASHDARAAAPRVKADVSPEVVSPGQSFQVQVEATSDEPGGVNAVDMPTPAGFRKLGERKTTTSSIVINGGSAERRQGLSVTYTFSSEKVGTTKLGPITVEAGGQRYKAQGPRVEVSKDAPPPQARRSNDPFAGLFGTLPGFDNDPFFDQRPPQRSAADPALGLPKARGDVLFFHAKVSPSDVVYGQKLVFDVLEYIEEGVRAPDFSNVHEANVDAFLSTPIEVRHDPRVLGSAEIEGKRYTVRLFRRFQLSPLKTGTLTVGALVGEVPTRSGKNAKRASEELQVIVREPPASGRPNGYVLGSVGNYEVKVDPLPASMVTGERTALVVHVTGSGAPPSKLVFRDFGAALRLGEPSISDRENSAPQGAITGVDEADPSAMSTTRTFEYLIEARAPGRLELGDVGVPTYLPNEKRYTIAKAALGALEVTGAAKTDDADSKSDPHERIVLDLGAPEGALGGAAAAPSAMPVAAYAAPVALPLLAWAMAWIRGRFARRAKPDAGPDLRTRIDDALRDGAFTTFAALLVEQVVGARTAREEWSESLQNAGKSTAEVTEFLQFVAEVDEARYAPSSSSDDLAARASSWRKKWA